MFLAMGFASLVINFCCNWTRWSRPSLAGATNARDPYQHPTHTAKRVYLRPAVSLIFCSLIFNIRAPQSGDTPRYSGKELAMKGMSE